MRTGGGHAAGRSGTADRSIFRVTRRQGRPVAIDGGSGEGVVCRDRGPRRIREAALAYRGHGRIPRLSGSAAHGGYE